MGLPSAVTGHYPLYLAVSFFARVIVDEVDCRLDDRSSIVLLLVCAKVLQTIADCRLSPVVLSNIVRGRLLYWPSLLRAKDV